MYVEDMEDDMNMYGEGGIVSTQPELTAELIAQNLESLSTTAERESYITGVIMEGYPEDLIDEGIRIYTRMRRMPVGDVSKNKDDEKKDDDDDDGGKDQNGDGLLTRDPGVLPPSVQKLLNSVGSETINKITVWRQPISVNQALKNMGLKLPYDNIFHLAVNLNGKYNLQKNEYIKFTTGKPEGEKLELNVGTPMTFDELFLKTKNRVGAEKFTEYDATDNNCQIFITNILKTLGSFTPEANKFVNQDAEKIFKSLGGPFAKFITGLAVKASQVVNKIQEGGEGEYKFPLHNNYLPLVQISFK